MAPLKKGPHLPFASGWMRRKGQMTWSTCPVITSISKADDRRHLILEAQASGRSRLVFIKSLAFLYDFFTRIRLCYGFCRSLHDLKKKSAKSLED